MTTGSERRRIGVGLAVVALMLIGAVAILPPVVSGLGLVAVIVLLAIMARPMLALYLLVFAIPYESLHTVQLGGLNATVTEYIALCGGITFLLRTAIRRESGASWAWWLLPLLLFISVAAISVTSAVDVRYSIKELLKLAEMVLTYLMVLSFVDSEEKVHRLFGFVVLAAVSQGVLGIVQSLAHFGPASFARGALFRASGTFDQPNPYSFYLNLTFPILVAGLLSGISLVGKWTKPAIALLGLALVLAVSRGALLALLAAIFFMIVVAAPRGRPLVALCCMGIYGVLAGAVFGFVPSSISQSALETFGVANVDILHPTPANWAVAERLAHVVAGFRMFVAHPVLGVGIGNYEPAYPDYRVINTQLVTTTNPILAANGAVNNNDVAADLWTNPLGHAHNYFVNVAAETGIIGEVAFLILLGSAVAIVIVLYRRSRAPVATALALGAFGVLITVIMESFFDNLFVHAMETQVALVIALATVACRLTGANSMVKKEDTGLAHG